MKEPKIKESGILNDVRLACASAFGARLFRNNTGYFRGAEGRTYRTGLCVGSGDLIGWIVVDGIAVFTSVEVKSPRVRVNSSQQKWLEAVNAAGGIAIIARSGDDAVSQLQTIIRNRTEVGHACTGTQG